MPIHDTPYEIRKPGKPKEVNQDASSATPPVDVPDPLVPDSLVPDPSVQLDSDSCIPDLKPGVRGQIEINGKAYGPIRGY